MKFLTSIVVAILTYSISYGQNEISENIKELYKQKKYDEIIKHKNKKGEEYSAKAYYFVAMSYYMKNLDDNAIKYFDIAIKKGPVDHDMFFYKGMALYFKGKYQESLPNFSKAIEMLPGEPDFYGGKGEAFYALNQKDSALYYFAKAIALPKCETRIFLLAGELYQEKNDISNALITYEAALKTIDKSSIDYQTTLYNVGLVNQLTGNIVRAKEMFEQSLSLEPNDFHCMAKLVQIFYSLDQIEKSKPYKEKLYVGYRNNKLPEGMKEMFCFDQFVWNNKRIMVFENFDEPEKIMYAKHQFFILDDKGDIEYRIDSESSIAIRMAKEDAKYVLCLVKNNTHNTYWHYMFNDTYDYKDLKKAVIDILENKVKPGSSATVIKK